MAMKRMSILIDPELKEEVEKWIEKQREIESVSHFIRLAIIEKLEK